MQLERKGHWSKSCSGTAKTFEIVQHAVFPDMPRACFDFKQFGLGMDRFSAFRVSVKFDEVKAMLAAFAEKGHPEAKAMMADLELARGVRALVEPQSSAEVSEPVQKVA